MGLSAIDNTGYIQNISYLEKLDALQSVYGMSMALAEAVGVSRRSLLNWRDRPDSIKPAYRLNIDVLYCTHFVIPEWDVPHASPQALLLPDHFVAQPAQWQGLVRRLSFGTVEIEDSTVTEAAFAQAIDAQKLPRNISRELYHEACNTFAVMQWLWQKILAHQEPLQISDEVIKYLHVSLMRGLRENAGFYASSLRIMGRLARVSTTLPEDIPEEVNRWVFRCAAASTLETIAEAHAWFIAIHPFGDGNGRVGRALLTAQCLNAGLVPPLLNRSNQPLYYAAMEHAMVHGRHAPLVRLLQQAAKAALLK